MSPDDERLDETFVFDLHAHGPGFVPPPFRAGWHALTRRVPPLGLGAAPGAGVGAMIAAAVGDPVVTRSYLGRTPWQAVEAQLVRVERQAAAADVVLADSVASLEQARRQRRAAVILGVEGADALGTDVDRVDAWWERGVRAVGLVHLGDNTLGTTSLPWQAYAGPFPVRRPATRGLSSLGVRVVERMNRLGLLVDVAHADRATVLDVVDRAAAPVLSTHAGARALQDFPRYLSDDELRAIAGTGGLVGLWPYRSHHHGVRDLGELAAHARHIAELVGPEHLAVGTDANGVPGLAAGYRGWADLAALGNALRDVGFDPTEVQGVLGTNALRVLAEVERCAH